MKIVLIGVAAVLTLVGLDMIPPGPLPDAYDHKVSNRCTHNGGQEFVYEDVSGHQHILQFGTCSIKNP